MHPERDTLTNDSVNSLDSPTLRTLRELHNPHIFCPLNNDALLASLGFPADHAHSLDWWDARSVTAALPSATPGGAPVQTTFKLTCTPAQHTANRSPFDRWCSLWASWAVEGDTPGSSVYFGGDTGYRTVLEGEDEDAVPVCPAFAEIGERFGGFELALLPIGCVGLACAERKFGLTSFHRAYGPRSVFSCMHVCPADSVRIFQDVKAKRALGMHWGLVARPRIFLPSAHWLIFCFSSTWVLTTEPFMEPPEKLKEACEKAGLAPGVFDICGLGETRVF